LIMLNTLNGVNGFKIDGEWNYIRSGRFVSGGGDFNGDGYDDLLIGAPNALGGQAGRSYVIFGGAGVGQSGLLQLSSLNGIQGFKIQGEAPDDQSGWSIKSAGDVNGDEYDDLLVGALNYNGTSRSYVVFGGLMVGSSGTLALSSL